MSYLVNGCMHGLVSGLPSRVHAGVIPGVEYVGVSGPYGAQVVILYWLFKQNK